MSMAADHNGLRPVGNQAGNVPADNGFTENSTTHNVTNGSVRCTPHFFQVEFLYTGFVWSDGGTFDAYMVFLDCFRSEEQTSELQSLMRISYAAFGLQKNKINE